MKDQKRNFLLYALSTVLMSVGSMFTAGTVLQQFLLSCGIGEAEVVRYNAAVQIVQCVMLGVCLVIGDNLSHSREWLTATKAVFALFIGVLLVVNCAGILPSAAFAVVMAAGITVNLAWGIRTVLEYKLPLMIMEKEGYSRFLAVTGFAGGLATLALTLGMSFLVNVMSYRDMMTVMLVTALVAIAASCATNHAVRVDPVTEAAGVREKVSLRAALNIFYPLMPFDLLRGLAAGVFGALLVLGTRFGILDSVTSVYYSAVYYAAMFVGAFLIYLTARVRASWVALVSCAAGALLLPVMFTVRDPYLFLALAFLAELSVYVEGVAVPIIVSLLIPTRDLGTYTARRMLVFTGATALSSFLVSLIIDGEAAVWLLPAAAGAQLAFGLGYFFFSRRLPRTENPV